MLERLTHPDEALKLLETLRDRTDPDFYRHQRRLIQMIHEPKLNELTNELKQNSDKVKLLEDTLKQPDAELARRTWAAALLHLVSEKSDVLLEVMDPQENQDSDLRAWLAYYLGRMKCDKAVEPTARQLLRDHALVVRIWSAAALGELGEGNRLEERLEECAVDALSYALEHDNYDVKAAAAAALGRIGGEHAIEPLLDHLLEETEPRHEVRRMAAQALAESLAPGRLEKIKNAETRARIDRAFTSALAKALTDEDSRTLAMVAETIKLVFVGQKATDFLLDIIRNSPSDGARINAARVLGGLGNDKAVEALQDDLYQDDATRSERAEEALAAIGLPSAAAALARRHNMFRKFYSETVQQAAGEAGKAMGSIITSASQSFRTRLWMHTIIFGVGIVLILVSIVVFFLPDAIVNKAEWYGSGGVIAGLAAILANFYREPVKEMKRDVGDLAQVHSALLGYTHRLTLIGMKAVHEYADKRRPDAGILEETSSQSRDAMAQTLLLLELYVEDNGAIKELLLKLKDKVDLSELFRRSDGAGSDC